MNHNPLLTTDFYKIGHPFQYPNGTQFVYANYTPRKSRLEGVSHMVFFGLQYFIKSCLLHAFNEHFFKRKKEDVLAEYKRRVVTALGSHLPSYAHIEALHDLGFLPIKIKALPEGSVVPMRVPCLTIVNTRPEFYWLTNFLETWMSAVIWQPCTSATIAYEYRKLLNGYADETGLSRAFVQWQGHDFSFRGMSSVESAVTSGMGHLLSFTGTDTIPAIAALEHYYNADAERELIGGSVAATEHSVMCAGGDCNELETFRRLITEVYPTGIVSIVSDTWDLWKVLTHHMRVLFNDIVKRDGKVVIRPDSGDPVDILCGTDSGDTVEERKGVVELLWDVFGGTINDKGYKVLDSHVGAIYGDSITRDRARQICERLKAKGFASQVVLGIGSYTYQYNTRDTFGTAIKATNVVINEESIAIYKDPATDDGMKKSAKGFLQVVRGENGFELKDNVSFILEGQGELRTVFNDGVLMVDDSLAAIRNRLNP
jgi:nicotinamide phosphoribosyltransferase